MVFPLKDNKGQVTLFVILGIIIVALTFLLLYLNTNLFLFNPTTEDLNEQMASIEEHISDCIFKVGKEPIERIGLQGGYLNTAEGSYVFHNDNTISYLCFNIEDNIQCMNRMLLKSNMEEQLENNLDFMLNGCIDVHGFKKFGGFEIITEEWESDVDIRNDEVVVKLHYPIRLKSISSNVEISMDSFYRQFDYPLGYLYDVSQKIIETEAIYGDFDQMIFMLHEKGKIKIEKKRPYPDKIYIMNVNDNDYVFQFAIQGEVN